MVELLARNQNRAKAAPILGVLASAALLARFGLADPLFWGLVNIPLYLFHQTEEHLWPGGFKDYINRNVNKDEAGAETLTDRKVFWINILLVWLAFAIFGALAFVNVGFGLVIIIFSIVNCLSHIVEGLKSRRWNPGLVMASLQFLVSIYAAWFLTTHGLENPLIWWPGALVFSAIVHILLFRIVMTSATKVPAPSPVPGSG